MQIKNDELLVSSSSKDMLGDKVTEWMRLFHDFACGNHSGIVDDTLIPMKKRQCSSQKKLINSLTCHCAKVWMYTAYLQVEFLSKFSVSPKVSWHCGIAFHSWQSWDVLGSSLERSYLTPSWRWLVSHHDGLEDSTEL